MNRYLAIALRLHARVKNEGGKLVLIQPEFWGYRGCIKIARKHRLLTFKFEYGRGVYDGCLLTIIKLRRKNWHKR